MWRRNTDVYIRQAIGGGPEWTTGRLTLQGGVRYDHILSSYPDSGVGGPDYKLMPAPNLLSLALD